MPNDTLPYWSKLSSFSVLVRASSRRGMMSNARFFLSVILHPMGSPGRRPHAGKRFWVTVVTGTPFVIFFNSLSPFLRISWFFPAPILRVTFSIRISCIGFVFSMVDHHSCVLVWCVYGGSGFLGGGISVFSLPLQ